MNKNNFKFRIFFIVMAFVLLPALVQAKIPNDPFAEQWAYKDIGLYGAWDTTVGSRDVVVAIIDNGFDSFHPDLMDNLWVNKKEISNNGIDDDQNGYVDDNNGWNFLAEDYNHDGVISELEKIGNNDPRPTVDDLSDNEKNEEVFSHGTVVAGLIGAVGNNGFLGVGVNWQVRLMNLKVVNNGGYGDLAQLARAIRYAVDNGADVINISMVSGEQDDSLKVSIHYAYEKGVAIFAAAGNNGYSLQEAPLYPICADAGASENWLLGVSAITANHHLASFSNVGSSCIDITAPGKSISSTVRFSPTNGLASSYRGNWNGTSFATPLVSGAAALIKSLQPNWGAKEIYQALLSTTHHTPNDDEAGYAELFGRGLLQVDKAVAYAKERMNLSRKISTIVYVDLSNGLLVNKDLSAGAENKNQLAILKGTVDFITVKVADKVYYGILRADNKKKISVEIYDEKWNKINAWNTDLKGEWQIALADVSGDKQLEVILTPKTAEKIVYNIYNLTGRKLSEHVLSVKHSGVVLTIGNNEETKKTDLVLAYNDQGLKIKRFSASGLIKEIATINNLSAIGNLGVGDLNGDGQEEYVVNGTKSEANQLFFYNSNGELSRSFSPYDAVTNLNFAVGDYDKDGKDDIIILPDKNNLPVRVWSGSIRKIDEWNADSGVKGKRKIISY